MDQHFILTATGRNVIKKASAFACTSFPGQSREHGFSFVSMKPALVGGRWVVVVYGTDDARSEVQRQDDEIVLRAVLGASQSPADLVWQVKYIVK